MSFLAQSLAATQAASAANRTTNARTSAFTTANGPAVGGGGSSTAALQVNPSIMTRSGGFVSTAKMPSRADLSLRRHQLGVYSHAGHGHPFHSYSTTYESHHQLKYSPHYVEMQNHQADQPSGATHNEARSNVIPKDIPRQSRVGAKRFDPTDATVPPQVGDLPGDMEDPRGEPIPGYPFVSDYKSTFLDPKDRFLGAGLEEKAPYQRNAHMAPHAMAPPFCSDSAEQEKWLPFSGSGYATNNAFAFEDRSRRKSREPAVSHYRETFLTDDSVTVPVLNDGTVEPPSWKSSNGYIRNGDLLPQVHATNEGGQPWMPAEFESHQRAVERESRQAPRQDSVPTRTIQRPQSSVAVNGSRRRRIEHSAFSRSERGPPADGVGSEHMKLRLGSSLDGETGLHHLSTRPHTAGFQAAPPSYHAAHTFRVAPIATRVGSGLEEAQQMATLKKLRTSDPIEYQYELHGAPRYKSTYSLAHEDPWKVQEEKVQHAGLAPYSSTDRGVLAGFSTGDAKASSAPTIENGGVARPYETSYQRATADAIQHASMVRAQGPSVAQPQGTGYTTNDHAQQMILQHASYTARGPSARFRLTSHEAFRHPAAHAQALPPAMGIQINEAAPLQSSYAREHAEASVFPAPVYNTITTLNGRTIVVAAKHTDLHPTVIKALQVKESAESGNWGGSAHPLKPVVPL